MDENECFFYKKILMPSSTATHCYYSPNLYPFFKAKKDQN